MRFKKGELDFYKSHDPNEIEKIYNNNPNIQEHILFFVTNYKYNFVKKKWEREY